jgi:exodeoxyribonuclease-1
VAGTFYWHDYETFGTDPSRDRPVQFAGIRTDEQLNIIGEPLDIFARPSDDVLPHPEACLVTGITPQKALAEGVPESEFIARILQELGLPGTCSVGYNSIRFDDEVTRYTLYRNFHDPYEREYKNGNSRWDIIDMVRLTCALRPEGINWPLREDGLPSFRLEELTAANGIGHEAAHDALSDVHATIAVARLIRERQPRLFDYAVQNRSKEAASRALDIEAAKPVLHVSGMFGAQRHNIALILPLALHPVNKQEVICYDLSIDPGPLADLSVEEIREALFTPAAQREEGAWRPGIKTVRCNRCPILVTPRLLDEPTARRLAIDVPEALRNREALLAMPDLAARLGQVLADREFEPITDPDRMLYSGGFFNNHDRKLIQQVASSTPEQLREQSFSFEDRRLPEMLFRYRARNYPRSLSNEEQAQWQEYRFAYLSDPESGASICLDEYFSRIESLLADSSLEAAKRDILAQLQVYGDQLLS